jgi:hypothetical protein
MRTTRQQARIAGVLYFAMALLAPEVPIIFWLLIWGARGKRAAEPV